MLQAVATRVLLPLLPGVSTLLLLAPPGLAQGGCPEPSIGPDVIVGDLPQLTKQGSIGDVTGYSLGTTSCNVGDAPLAWIWDSDQHPVIAQNMFRVEDGAIRQIGQSWLKHGLNALQFDLCCDCIPHPDQTFLGVGCSDPYSATINAVQPGLGPRFEVDPFTGQFPYPFTGQGLSGDVLYKRLQVANDDLDPDLHPDARYVVEGHYVTPDDAAAGNQFNNASYRRFDVGPFANGGYLLALTGTTRQEQPAIFAWREAYPTVQLNPVEPPGDGRFWVGSRVEYLGNGTWRYEYAIQNLCSDRGAGSLRIPFPNGTTVTDVSFHDVDYHSGEPFDGTDWSVDLQPDSLTWSTTPHAVDPDANALRWGTLYGFGFTADSGPLQESGELGLFKPGSVGSIDVPLQVPGDDCIGTVTSYCVSSPNSYLPGGASILTTGTTSVALDNLMLMVDGAVPNELALFFYGPSPASVPFGDGVRCVAPGGTGLVRLAPMVDVDFFGFAARPLEIGQPPVATGTITPGSTWFFQCWYRDSQGAAGFNFTDALEITFCQ